MRGLVGNFIVGVLLFWLSINAAVAEPQPLLPFGFNQPVTICEFESIRAAPPTFSEPECSNTKMIDVDPQHSTLWVSIQFDRLPQWSLLPEPLGLFLFGKAASQVYLNGELLGSNGAPGDARSEVAGRMDTVFHVPSNLLRAENNHLILYLSGHHSIVELGYPIHFVGLGQFGDTREHVQKLSRYGLVLLGAFVIGGIYFLFLSWGAQAKAVHRLFAMLCCIAALQLGIELSRGLFNYPYPWHDLRLLLVTGFSFSFGTLLLGYCAYKVAQQHYLHWLYAGIILTIVTIILIPGFDAKTTAGIFIPLLVSLIQIVVYWRRHNYRRLVSWFWVQLTAAITIVVSAAAFHEIIYFSLIALLLCYLFVYQAREHREQQLQLRLDESTISKLEYKLAEKAQSAAPSKLVISSAGKTDIVSTRDIAFCKAAGDYVEVHLLDHTVKLFSGSLKQLEGQLPVTFLKVHRSYVVNLDEIESLVVRNHAETRENVLQLTNQGVVPVSRRLLPMVRDSLKQSVTIVSS